MHSDFGTLLNEFDRGRLSRRQLLQALGVAAALRPASAFAQGQCGGAKAGTPECDPTPAKLPFAATGWKTVLLDHLSCQAADYAKEAAYYQALMNWTIRSDDGKLAMLDIGDWGGLAIRGGYVAPPRRRPLPRPPQVRVLLVATARAVRARRAWRRSTDSAGASSRGTRKRWKPS